MGGWNKGIPASTSGKGALLAWVRANVNHADEDCLIWPFGRTTNGYGQLGCFGKVLRAHRLMCELAHGEPPSPAHHAAHSCGNGHLGCVNPRHLSWKTPAENRLDSNEHGTGKGLPKPRRLTKEIARQMRSAMETTSYYDVARQFGVSPSTASKLKRGEIWKSA